MFRRITSTVLILVLLFSCLTVFAAGQPAMESFKGNESYYIADSGYIYSIAGSKVSTLQAETILYTGKNGICYISVNQSGMRRLVYQAFGRNPSVFASSIDNAAYSKTAGYVYYTTTDDKTTVYRCSPEKGSSVRACVTENDVVSMSGSIYGLLMVCQDSKGDTLTWLLRKGKTEPELSSVETEYTFDDCAVQVTHNGTMKLVYADMDYSMNVDYSPEACTMIGNNVFYTKSILWSKTTQLRKFSSETGKRTSMASFDGDLCPVITADEMYIYLLTDDGLLYAVNTETAESMVIEDLGTSPDAPYMLISNGVLYIYNAPAGEIPSIVVAYELTEEEDFVFCDPIVTYNPKATAKPTAKATVKPTVRPTVKPTVKPTVRPTVKPTATPKPVEIKSGSKGTEVKKMQEELINLGYLAKGQADGSFGAKTLRAVKLFQEAVGVTETGVMTQELLDKLYDYDAPLYDAYKPLSSGCKGVRVTDLQTQLQEHGYIATAPDGEFGPNTKAAVKRLQEELGMYQTGIMSRSLMVYVYNGKMPDYSDYIDLVSGNSGPRVTELQNRLKKLGYYTGKVTGSYDKNTVEAVKLFELNYSSKTTGKATVSLQQKLFNKNAPYYVEPTPKPTAKPTAKPTLMPSFEPTSDGIDSTSSYGDICALQNKLYELGYIEKSGINGSYDKTMKNVIGGIQTEMRQNGINVKVSGHADSLTLEYIDDMYYGGQPAPSAKPTVDPSEEHVIGPDSSYEELWTLQSKLYELGRLEKKAVSGSYNSATKAAIGEIQKEMCQNGTSVTVNGRAGQLTQEYIDYLYAQLGEMNKYIETEDLELLAQLFNTYIKDNNIKHDQYTTATAVSEVKTILKAWGWYDTKYVPDSVYDDDLFDNISQIRTLLSESDAMLEVFDEHDAGKIDDFLFVYIVEMIENDPDMLEYDSVLQAINLR